MICPQCGYRASTADDPLLTKYNGLGECPQCGIIPQKHLEKTSQKAALDSQLQAESHVSASPSTSVGGPIVKLSLICGLLLLTVAGAMYFKGPATSEKGSPQVTVNPPAPAKEEASQTSSNMASLLDIRENYQRAIQGRSDIESLLAAADMAAASINAIPLGDPQIENIRSSCSSTLDSLVKHLSACKEAKYQLASIETQISNAKADMQRELAAMNAEVDAEKDRLGGMSEPLRYNNNITISGEYNKRIQALNATRNQLTPNSKYNNRLLDKVYFECWKKF